MIADARLINDTRPELWHAYSARQVYLAALNRTSPSHGPSLTFTGCIPDLDHYNGRGGRAFPLWADAAASQPNVQPDLLAKLTKTYGRPVSAEDVMAYIAAVAAHPGYVARFAPDLVQPGLRIPVTAEPALFAEAVRLGREVVWLHTFGERFAAPAESRPAAAPRMQEGARPHVPTEGAIPSAADAMPDAISYNAPARRLHVGAGYVDNVPPEVWAYEVSGKQVLTQWFSYRGRDRSRPIIGDRRPPSPLGDVQPDGWLAEYTTELLNVLNVLGRLVALEPRQVSLLDRICAGPILSGDEIKGGEATTIPTAPRRRERKHRDGRQGQLLG